MFMTIQESVQDNNNNNNNNSKGIDDDEKIKLSKRLTNLSPCSLSAAVNSAFNLLKHKQSLVKNGSRNSDTSSSSSSSVNSTTSSTGYNKTKRSNNSNSDDEICPKSDAYNQYQDNYENYDDSQNDSYSQQQNNESKFADKLGHFYQNQIPMLNCIKYFESPINQSQIQYDCTAPIARNTPENNEVRLVDYRQSKIASFTVDSKELICLPQAFEMFLKNLVGGLHTVYTKLKRLDIVPIVCNVEQVRVLRGLGAIQPGVNRCKLIAPNEFDILYEDCTNSGSRPGRPPKRHAQNESNETINNQQSSNNVDDSSPSPIHQKPTKMEKSVSNLSVRLENQLNHAVMMSPYSSSSYNTTLKHIKSDLVDEKRNVPNLSSPNFYADKKKQEEQSSYAAAINSFNYMQKFGFLAYPGLKADTAFHNGAMYSTDQNSLNSAAASLALRLFQPHLANLQNMQQPEQMPNYLNDYNMNSIYNNQNEIMQKSCNRVQEDRLLAEQKQQTFDRKTTKNYSDSLVINSSKAASRQEELFQSKSTNRMFNEDANSDLDEEEEEDEKFSRKKSNLHPLSVEYLIGGSNASSTSSRNDSIDVLTNAGSSSSPSSNNYVHNLFSPTRSTPSLLNEDEKNKSNKDAWPNDLYQNNSLLYVCSLINIVKNSVCKLDASFKSDIDSLRKSLQAEKLLRLKCDSKIHHLIRLQNILRNKLKTQSLISIAKMRKRRSILRNKKMQNSSINHITTVNNLKEN